MLLDQDCRTPCDVIDENGAVVYCRSAGQDGRTITQIYKSNLIMKNIFLNAASYSIRLVLCIWLEIPEERQQCKIVPDNYMLHYGRYLINAEYIHPQVRTAVSRAEKNTYPQTLQLSPHHQSVRRTHQRQPAFETDVTYMFYELLNNAFSTA